MSVRQAVPRRRPVDWRRYSAEARRARRRIPRFERPLAVTVLVSLVFTVAGVTLLQAIGVGIAGGLGDLGRSVVDTLPRPKNADLVIGEAPVTVSTALLLDPLPEFTKTAAVGVSGKVPTFALKPGRAIVLGLNGVTVGSATIAADGRFGPAPLTLSDGTNTVTVGLVDGAAEVASASATIVLDQVPPALAIVRPKTGDTVDGPDLTVEGKTEATASVTLNDRVLRPNPDGTFADRLTALAPGPLTVTIVATDKAGNETKTELKLTVKPASSSPAAAGTSLTVSLDRTTVRRGETVVATIAATAAGRPKADLLVTLQVGVVTIGTYKTDATGFARVGFAAPDHEVTAAAVVVLGGGTSATTSLTVADPRQ